jgi:hypothetical protein
MAAMASAAMRSTKERRKGAVSAARMFTYFTGS